jgi:hypothetical protein
MTKYGEAVKKGFRFIYNPKRWLPLFVLDSAFFLIVALLFTSNIPEFLSAMSSMAGGLTLVQIGSAAMGIILSFLVWFALRFLVMSSIIHQAFHEKDFRKSWTVARQRYISIIGVVFVVASVGVLASILPFIGAILGILVSWAFFFAFQDVISTNRDSLLALNNSMKIFKRRPLPVIASWLIVSILSGVIIILFALPMMFLFFNVALENIMLGVTDPSQFVAGMLVSLQSNLAAFLGTGLVLVLGIALSSTLALKVQTELYQQIKKDLKPLVFRLLP